MFKNYDIHIYITFTVYDNNLCSLGQMPLDNVEPVFCNFQPRLFLGKIVLTVDWFTISKLAISYLISFI